MTLGDWGTAVGMGVGVLTLVGGLVAWLDRRMRDWRAELARDIDGLAQQLASVRGDAERRYMPRDEHADSVRGLTDAMARLEQTIRDFSRDFSRQIFELARGTGAH